jgi:hypothetical protein
MPGHLSYSGVFFRGLGSAALVLAAAGCNANQVAQADGRDKPPQPKEAPAAGSKEAVKPPVQPVPAESRSAEEAAKRAADPKDPSGALIVEPPAKAR